MIKIIIDSALRITYKPMYKIFVKSKIFFISKKPVYIFDFKNLFCAQVWEICNLSVLKPCVDYIKPTKLPLFGREMEHVIKNFFKASPV